MGKVPKNKSWCKTVLMDKDTVYPDKAVMTVAKEHDRTQLES